ncbi:MAG: hypothetical protein V1755_00665 [Chloroflexota bacterium]
MPYQMYQPVRAVVEGDPWLPDAAMDFGRLETPTARRLLMLRGYLRPSDHMSCGWPLTGMVTG